MSSQSSSFQVRVHTIDGKVGSHSYNFPLTNVDDEVLVDNIRAAITGMKDGRRGCVFRGPTTTYNV